MFCLQYICILYFVIKIPGASLQFHVTEGWQGSMNDLLFTLQLGKKMELEKLREGEKKRERERENNNDTVSSLSSVGNRGSEELGIFGLSHPGLHWLASCLWELTWETIGGTNYKFSWGNETLSLGFLWKIFISSNEYLLFWKEGIPGKIILADIGFLVSFFCVH